MIAVFSAATLLAADQLADTSGLAIDEVLGSLLELELAGRATVSGNGGALALVSKQSQSRSLQEPVGQLPSEVESQAFEAPDFDHGAAQAATAQQLGTVDSSRRIATDAIRESTPRVHPQMPEPTS